MIVIERDGRFVVITGWRAWLLAAVALVATIAVLAALAFPGSRHRGQRGGVCADHPAGGGHRGAGSVDFPTAESLIDSGPWLRRQPAGLSFK
jgi:hypothetical protein